MQCRPSYTALFLPCPPPSTCQTRGELEILLTPKRITRGPGVTKDSLPRWAKVTRSGSSWDSWNCDGWRPSVSSGRCCSLPWWLNMGLQSVALEAQHYDSWQSLFFDPLGICLMFNYGVIFIGYQCDFSNVTMPGERIRVLPFTSHPPHGISSRQRWGSVHTVICIDLYADGSRRASSFHTSPSFSRWVHFGVLCFLEIFLSGPLIRPVLFSCPDIFVAVQNANAPVPWTDGAGKSPPLTPPRAPPPHPCTLRCWFFSHSGGAFTFWSELHPSPIPFSHFADSLLPWLQMPARAHYFDSHNWLDFFTNYISTVWE